ncbi:hypothetical protein ACTQ6A_01450 [Lachnospiraceae bacterium LCP25S3_G4]
MKRPSSFATVMTILGIIIFTMWLCYIPREVTGIVRIMSIVVWLVLSMMISMAIDAFNKEVW